MKRFRNSLFISAFIIITFAKCIPTTPVNPGNPTPAVYREIIDTAYGTDAKQKMNIYLPQGRTTLATKTIILIHGGGWQSGDKSDTRLTDIINRIKITMPDAAIVNINYRLVNGAGNPTLPDLMSDITLAINFLKINGNAFAISNRFALWGFSAGGHLATLYTYAYDANNDVKVVSDWFGPMDFLNTDPNEISLSYIVNGKNAYILERELLGGIERVDNLALWLNASPLERATAASKPTFIIHHENDLIVPFYHSSYLNTKLNTLGVTHSFINAKGIVNQQSYNIFGFYMPDVANSAHDFTDPMAYPITPDSRVTDGVRNYTVDTTLGFIKRFL